jgi:hypothetical protein
MLTKMEFSVRVNFFLEQAGVNLNPVLNSHPVGHVGYQYFIVCRSLLNKGV